MLCKAQEGGAAPSSQKPVAKIVVSLTCFGCQKFITGDDHKKLKKLEQEGVLTLKYVPFIHDIPCLIGTCLSLSKDPQMFKKNYLFLLEHQSKWMPKNSKSKEWEDALKKIAQEELNIPEDIITEAFTEYSNTQNKVLLQQSAFLRKNPLKFVPCIILNGSAIEADYKKVIDHPDVKSAMGKSQQIQQG